MESVDKHKDGISKNTFPKTQRLGSKRLIEELFNKGLSHYLYPFRLHYLPHIEGQPAFPQVLVSVSKRNFKKAVDRNRIKRQLKEAYRKNKNTLFAGLEANKIPSCLGFVYIAKEKIPFEELEKKLNLVLLRLKNTD